MRTINYTDRKEQGIKRRDIVILLGAKSVGVKERIK
jgi:hypothetical protein